MVIKILRELLLIRKELLLIREELQAIHRDLESSKKMNGEEMDCQLGERYKQSSEGPCRMVCCHIDGKIIANNISRSGYVSELLHDQSHTRKETIK